jgi:hypothetical protein
MIAYTKETSYYSLLHGALLLRIEMCAHGSESKPETMPAIQYHYCHMVDLFQSWFPWHCIASAVVSTVRYKKFWRCNNYASAGSVRKESSGNTSSAVQFPACASRQATLWSVQQGSPYTVFLRYFRRTRQAARHMASPLNLQHGVPSTIIDYGGSLDAWQRGGSAERAGTAGFVSRCRFKCGESDTVTYTCTSDKADVFRLSATKAGAYSWSLSSVY